MRAFRKRKQEETIDSTSNNSSVRVLGNDSGSPAPATNVKRSTEPIRYVIIGDKVEAFTPQTRYKGILPDGRDYYPYYDFTLNDATPNDLKHYIDKLFQQLRSDL